MTGASTAVAASGSFWASRSDASAMRISPRSRSAASMLGERLLGVLRFAAPG